MSGLDIDTRSDVYSLGVLLYELLTGSTPIDRQRLREAAFDEIQRVIREEEPSKPSTKISESGDALPSIAAQRKIEPRKLGKLLRGDLDWIIMKALEKDRARRYETANGFAMDLERYLNDEPVVAGPPSAGYKRRKFARKHKGVLGTAAAFAAILIVGTVISTWLAIRATDAETLARQRLVDVGEQRDIARRALGETRAAKKKTELALADLTTANRKTTAALEETVQAKQHSETAEAQEREARETAEKRLAQIEKGNEILGSIFKNLDPKAEEKEGKPLRVLLGERLDRATRELAGEAVGDPLAVAKLQMTLGDSQSGLGYPEKAIVLLTKARATFTDQLGPEHLDTLASMNNLAEAYRSAGKLDLALRLHASVWTFS